MRKAEMITDKGTMTIRFYDNDAPIAADNFIKLERRLL
jgi:cyclophilin family peptidyl-prolyl cis-trans isomerase